MRVRPVSVLTFGALKCASLPWSNATDDDTSAVSVTQDPEAARDAVLRRSAALIVDLAGVRGTAAEDQLRRIERVLHRHKRGGGPTPLIVCTARDYLAVACRFSARARVVCRHAALYSPAVLESRRLLHNHTVGVCSRLDLWSTAARGAPSILDLALAVLFFLGAPDGVRAGEPRDRPTLIFDYRGAEASIRGVECAAPQSEVGLSGVVEGGKGRMVFDSASASVTLELFSTGTRTAPLPEGSGSYYFVKNAIALARGMRDTVDLIPFQLVEAATEAARVAVER